MRPHTPNFRLLSARLNSAVAIDYILDLTSGVTGRIVELLRHSARVTLGRDTAQLTVADLQYELDVNRGNPHLASGRRFW